MIGMTCMPEAKLAREAQICYALIALPTDYDCWRARDPDRGEDELLSEILANLQRASDAAVALIRAALRRMKGGWGECRCHNALKQAIWSDRSRIDPSVSSRLGLLVGPDLADL